MTSFLIEKKGYRLNLINRKWREEKAASWASVGLLFFVTAFIWAPSKDGLIGIYSLAFFIPMLLVLPWRAPRLSEYGGKASLMAFLFSGYCVFSVSWGKGEEDELIYFLGVWLLLISWLFGVAWLQQRRPLDVERLYKSVIVVGVAVAISVLLIFYWNHPLTERLSAWTVARNPVVVAQIFGVVSLLAWIQSWRESNQLRAWCFFFAALLSFLVCLMTQSRGPLLAFAVTLSAAFLVLRPFVKLWVGQLTFLIFLAIAYHLLIGVPPEIWERGIAWSYRDVIWANVFQRIPENFWFGVGLTKDTTLIIPDVDVFQHAHNAYLDTFFRAGFIGFLLILAHTVVLFHGWRNESRLLPLYFWLIFGILCVLSNTRIFFWQLDAKWFLYWVPAGLIVAINNFSNSSKQES